MDLLKPYFLTNDKWFYHDADKMKYFLTKEGKAINKVVTSYNKFYKLLNSQDK